jgi:hypothetical protein
MLGENTSTIIRENTESLLGACREVGLEVHTEKTKNMALSCHQNAGQNHYLLTAKKTFENVAKFKYLRTATDQNCLHKQIKSRLNS